MSAAGSGSSLPRLRAIAYARVSTVRQAATELSLDEQRRKVAAFAELRDADLVETFVDYGLSGTKESREEFQRMVKFACDPMNGIKLVIVYNFSRFFRNVTAYLKYREIFEQAGVKLVSATQDIPEGPAGKIDGNPSGGFRRSCVGSEFGGGEGHDDRQRAAGYWNGARAPFGYRVVEALKVGTKIRKRIEIDPLEEPVVHRIYDLCLTGGGAGPMGMKKIAAYLNERGIPPARQTLDDFGYRADPEVRDLCRHLLLQQAGQQVPQDAASKSVGCYQSAVDRQPRDIRRRGRGPRGAARLQHGAACREWPTLLTGLARADAVRTVRMVRSQA